MARIFISYSRSDRPFVDQFVPLIRRVYGNDCLWFDADIHGGVDWWQMILDEINQCEVFIYLISNESLASPYCRSELREALRLKKQILPVMVRRLKPAYPGSVEADLADVLRRTHYVDLSGGFSDANTLSDLYAALTRLLNAASQPSGRPVTITPTPEPPVSDKKKANPNIRAAYIAGVFALIAAIIAGVFGLWPILNSNGTSTSTPTSAVTSPLSDSQKLQTVEASGTQTAEAQTILNQTATEEARLIANVTGTAIQIAATESAAHATLIALSATPTPTATLSPEDIARTAVAHNADWTPYERDFDRITMVLVPAGCFMMGSEDGDSDEQPVYKQCFDEPFWIDKTEVTNAQYGSTGCDQWSSEPNQPRNCVDWFEARDFCAIRGGRLPTEAEWEYAARGADGLVYPWGNDFISENVVYSGNSNSQTVNVGSRPGDASWVGALDMSGNVWEWASSLYADYPYGSDHENDGNETDVRVLRGGSFLFTTYDLRAANRYRYDPVYGNFSIGFRCARS